MSILENKRWIVSVIIEHILTDEIRKTYVLVGIVINNKNISAAFHLKLHL